MSSYHKYNCYHRNSFKFNQLFHVEFLKQNLVLHQVLNYILLSLDALYYQMFSATYKLIPTIYHFTLTWTCTRI